LWSCRELVLTRYVEAYRTSSGMRGRTERRPLSWQNLSPYRRLQTWHCGPFAADLGSPRAAIPLVSPSESIHQDDDHGRCLRQDALQGSSDLQQPKLRPPNSKTCPELSVRDSVCPSHSSGGYGIRTREGVNPTRFPSCLRRCSLGFSPSAMSAVAGSGTSANGEERGQLRRELRRRQRLATACDEVGTAVRVVNLPPAPTSDV
jgi:hypothetical protein